MIPVDQVAARLVSVLPELAGRVGTAAQFSAAWNGNTLGQVPFAAYLLGLGFQGADADIMANIYRQQLDRALGIVLVRRALADPIGTKVSDAFAEDTEKVLQAIAGWAPADAQGEPTIGVFVARRGALISLSNGVATFQIDFTLNTQLRITT